MSNCILFTLYSCSLDKLNETVNLLFLLHYVISYSIFGSISDELTNTIIGVIYILDTKSS